MPAVAILSDDIIRDLILRIQKVASGFDEAMAQEIERQVRADWAGTEPYIAADPSATGKKRVERREKAQAELARGRPVAEVSRKTGMARSAVYKLLRRGSE